MKLYNFLIIINLFLASNLYAQDRSFNVHRCLDPLNEREARERTLWAYKCAKENGGTFQGFDKSVFFSMLFAIDDETRQIVPNHRIVYPAFSTFDLEETWRAPTNRDSSCEVKEGFTITHTCSH